MQHPSYYITSTWQHNPDMRYIITMNYVQSNVTDWQGWRPDGKYKDEYCNILVKWFEEESRKLYELSQLTDGTFDKLPPDPPTMARFTRDVAGPKWRVARSTLYGWMKEHPEFAASVEMAMTFYEAWLDRIASAGIGSASWHNLAAKNRLGWVDKTDVTTKGQALPAGGNTLISGNGAVQVASSDMAASLAATMAKLGLTSEAQDEVSQNAGETLPESVTNAESGANTPSTTGEEEF